MAKFTHVPRQTFTTKRLAIRAAKRLGLRYVLFYRDGARNGIYIVDRTPWIGYDIVWEKRNG